MRFMMVVKATKDSEAGVPPSPELLDAMMKYNEELARAGVLLAAEGLHPNSGSIRISYPVPGGNFMRAASLTHNLREQDRLQRWAELCMDKQNDIWSEV